MTTYSILKTSLDDIILVASGDALTGLYFSDQARVPVVRADWTFNPREPLLEQAAGQIEEYLAGDRTTFSIPLAFTGTPFQQRVWREIAMIPFGETITYSHLASRAGSPDAIRAAGTAASRNRIGIIVPCHRVVGKDGSLTGYAGGLSRKRRLLELEEGAMSLVS